MLASMYELVSKSLCFLEPLAHSNLINNLNRLIGFFLAFVKVTGMAKIAHHTAIASVRTETLKLENDRCKRFFSLTSDKMGCVKH